MGGVQGARTAKGIVAYAKANMPSLVKVGHGTRIMQDATCKMQRATCPGGFHVNDGTCASHAPRNPHHAPYDK